MQKLNKKISLVMCTYNGEKYLIEQLGSIYRQTQKLDEVIIRDDGSSDSTFELIENYIKNNNLENWTLIQNDHNVGWKVNFKLALEMTTGDFIFLCDQDDIWKDEKIQKMMEYLERNSNIELLSCRVNYLRNGNISNEKCEKIPLTKVVFDKHFFCGKRMGCSFAFRRSLLEETLKVWDDNLAHDVQLTTIATLRESFYLLNEPLMVYRRHTETATGHDPLTVSIKLNNTETDNKKIYMADKYLSLTPELISQYKIEIINVAKEYTNCRWNLFKTKKIKYAIILLKYLPFYIHWKTYLGDLYVTFSCK